MSDSQKIMDFTSGSFTASLIYSENIFHHDLFFCTVLLNTLYGMPLEVLEEIYGLLDFVDKKSFSETCNGLPNFANLVYLDLSSCFNANFDLSPPAETVAMEHLQFMLMSLQMFAYLEGNFINFTTNRLRKVWICTKDNGPERFNEDETLLNFRQLLSRQKSLKFLSLNSSNGLQIFSTALLWCQACWISFATSANSRMIRKD